MRRIVVLLALSLVAPASAQTLECAALKAGPQPFELTLDSSDKAVGKDPNALQIRRQVHRKADETTVTDIFPSDKTLRRTYYANGLLKEFLGFGETAPHVASYSIDTGVDYFGLGKPFEFHNVMKTADGKADADTTTSVTFDADVAVDLGGCSFKLTRIVEATHGVVNDKPVATRVELWYSRELKTSLYSRLETQQGYILELRASAIATTFTPVQ